MIVSESVPKSDLEVPPNRGWWWESALLLLLCYIKAGWPPPDVNEAHYLGKAKHFWDPTWAAGDFFLQSADAHAPFYFAFGWVTLLVSLPATAWIGRLLIWGLISLAWQRLSWALVPVRFAAVISGGLMIVLTQVGHMAGEWIIGGVEAKGFAFALVFWGLERMVRNRWNTTFVLFGGAAAFHVLVGGWAVVAAGIAWLAMGSQRPALVRLLPGLAGGFALSLLGLAPAILLSRGVDAATVQEANYIYVFERLPHHLVFHQFPHAWMARHAALAAVFFGLALLALRTDRARLDVRRLLGFVGGAVGIAVVGIIIDQSTLYHDTIAARLLRFYWYRPADAMVPCGVALLLPLVIEQQRARRPQLAAWASVGVLLLAFVPLLMWNLQRQQHPLPGATLQTSQQGEQPLTMAEAEARHADWVATCRWIAENTPRDAIFLTPRNQQTFKWYAERAEVVAVKDIPQDARGIVDWRKRLNDVFAYPVNRFGYAALSDEQMAALANRYDASFVILDNSPRMPPWKKVYPLLDETNDTYAVYEVPR